MIKYYVFCGPQLTCSAFYNVLAAQSKEPVNSVPNLPCRLDYIPSPVLLSPRQVRVYIPYPLNNLPTSDYCV